MKMKIRLRCGDLFEKHGFSDFAGSLEDWWAANPPIDIPFAAEDSDDDFYSISNAVLGVLIMRHVMPEIASEHDSFVFRDCSSWSENNVWRLDALDGVNHGQLDSPKYGEPTMMKIRPQHVDIPMDAVADAIRFVWDRRGS